ncbi:MAG: FISUMP domain-containing protein, partial [Bacteroidota bacterium]
YSYIPVNNDAITCVLTSNAICPTGNPATSNIVTMTVNPLEPVSVSVTASANSICAGTLVTYTAAPINGGTNPAFQWKINGTIISGATNATYSYVPVNNDAITCLLTSNAVCPTGNPATSNTLTMTVNSLAPVSVSVTASANSICAGTLVTFTTAPVNGGSTPLFQWKLNGTIISGATNISYSYIPVNNDAITCVLTSNAICPTGNPATSNTVTMTVNPLEPVSVSVAASANSICAGTLVTYTAAPTNGGPIPAFQWKLNGTIISGATNTSYSYIPVNNDAITCLLTSNAICPTGNPATSNIVTMTVNPLEPVSISVTTSANSICAGTLVTYTAVPTNGGLIPAFQWKLNGTIISGATNTSYSYIPVNNDAITCVLTSNAICPTGTPATSNEIVMIVNPVLAVSITITANPAGDFCAGTSVTFNASGVNGGNNPLYQWTINGTAMGGNSPIYNYFPSNGDIVQCTLTSSGICATGNPAFSNLITNTINLNFPVSISIVSNPPGAVCYGVPVTFNATPVNGGNSPHFQWKVNGLNTGTDMPSYSYLPENNDVVICQLTSNLMCATSNPALSNSHIVTITTSPAVTYTACHDMVTAVNAKPFKLHGGLPLGGVYSGPGVNSVTGIFDPLSAGVGSHQITYTFTNSGLCIASNFVTIINQGAIPVVCGNSMIDYRDNKIYPTVQIGSQCWMASNLNFGNMSNFTVSQVDNCIVEKYCFNDSEANCTQFGGLYQWDELMRYDPVPGGQGLCPPGWHVPTDLEWLILFNFYGGQSVAGTLLKTQGTGNFCALLNGVVYQNHTWSFHPPGLSSTFFWTSETVGQWQIKSHGLNSMTGSVSDYSSARGNGLAVRCLLD